MSQKRAPRHQPLDKKEQKELITIAKAMIKEGLTIRQAVDKFGIPRATLHKRIHNHLPVIDADLYKKLKESMGGRRRNKKS
jgi:transcriptional regulator of acetoin/glycerol metabolism